MTKKDLKMPYLKFDNPSGFSSNKGSCESFVNYLGKEDYKESLSKEFFFNHKSLEIIDMEVISTINWNKKGLGRNDAKFYTGSINFSEEELLFIGNDTNKVKEYSIKVMEQYASSFKKDIAIDDINWYGKVEHNRYFKGEDDEVKLGIVTQGEVKPGLNTHVHFIVGRKSRCGKYKLSPKTNHIDTKSGPVKGGFNRDEFKKQGEAIFDSMFGYLRPIEESYNFNKISKNGTVEECVEITKQLVNERILKTAYSCQNVDEKEKRIKQLANYICYGRDRDDIKRIDTEKILQFEQETNHNGYVYRSLVNLNRMCKQGIKPTEYDLTETVLHFARHLEYKKSLSTKIDSSKPKLSTIEFGDSYTIKSSIATMLSSSLIYSNDEDPVEKEKKKRKRSRKTRE